MRVLRKGDVIRLRANLPADTVRGVRSFPAGWEFEVISTGGGDVKAWDGNGVKVLLPVYAVEFVRAAHSPDDSAAGGNDGDNTGGGPVGLAGRVSRLGKRRGLVRVPRAA